jgi:hypothetical protein
VSEEATVICLARRTASLSTRPGRRSSVTKQREEEERDRQQSCYGAHCEREGKFEFADEQQQREHELCERQWEIGAFAKPASLCQGLPPTVVKAT